MLTTVVLLIALFIVAVSVGAGRQRRALTVQIDRLIRSGAGQNVERRLSVPLDNVPPPVARYLRFALQVPQQLQEVRIEQVGTLRTDVASHRWMPFEAEHIVVPPATGFVWNARVSVAPLLHVRVRDALIDGKGSGQVALLSAFSVSSDAATPEMDSGSLHRFLAEAVWYPTALLPGPNLTWTGIDASRAEATLTHHGVTVSLEFRFASTGEVTGIYTPARWGTFGRRYRQVAWEGHFRNYRERDGLFVPTEGDVGWYVDGQWRPVWKGTITSFRINIGAS